MRFYEAYSLELGRIIPLDTAIQALDVEDLEGPDMFLCPDLECFAPIQSIKFLDQATAVDNNYVFFGFVGHQ